MFKLGTLVYEAEYTQGCGIVVDNSSFSDKTGVLWCGESASYFPTDSLYCVDGGKYLSPFGGNAGEDTHYTRELIKSCGKILPEFLADGTIVVATEVGVIYNGAVVLPGNRRDTGEIKAIYQNSKLSVHDLPAPKNFNIGDFVLRPFGNLSGVVVGGSESGYVVAGFGKCFELAGHLLYKKDSLLLHRACVRDSRNMVCTVDIDKVPNFVFVEFEGETYIKVDQYLHVVNNIEGKGSILADKKQVYILTRG